MCLSKYKGEILTQPFDSSKLRHKAVRLQPIRPALQGVLPDSKYGVYVQPYYLATDRGYVLDRVNIAERSNAMYLHNSPEHDVGFHVYLDRAGAYGTIVNNVREFCGIASVYMDDFVAAGSYNQWCCEVWKKMLILEVRNGNDIPVFRHLKHEQLLEFATKGVPLEEALARINNVPSSQPGSSNQTTV